jgi:hypothetical protein
MIEPIDHQDLAISRLATQFRESANLIAYIRALVVESNNLEEMFNSLLNDRWIDTAFGVQLDILGAIVGQPRTLIESSTIVYFGFDGDIGSEGFTDLNNTALGGRFIGLNEPATGFRELDDEEYRIFIRFRILKNITKGTINEVIEQIRQVFDFEFVILTELPNAKYRIEFDRELTLNEFLVLTQSGLIIKPVGVGVEYIMVPFEPLVTENGDFIVTENGDFIGVYP